MRCNERTSAPMTQFQSLEIFNRGNFPKTCIFDFHHSDPNPSTNPFFSTTHAGVVSMQSLTLPRKKDSRTCTVWVANEPCRWSDGVLDRREGWEIHVIAPTCPITCVYHTVCQPLKCRYFVTMFIRGSKSARYGVPFCRYRLCSHPHCSGVCGAEKSFCTQFDIHS